MATTDQKQFELYNRRRAINQAPEQDFINTATETDLTVNFDDRNARVESIFEFRVGIDVDLFDIWQVFQIASKDGLGVITQMAFGSRIDDKSPKPLSRRMCCPRSM